MESFESLRTEHNQLLEDMQESESTAKMISRAKDFVIRVRKSGSKISSSSEREQLRAILRYWGNLIYENESENLKTFPITDLYPYSGVPGKMNRNFWILSAVLVGLILVIFLSSFIFQLILNNRNPAETLTPDVSSIELATLKAAATSTSLVELTQQQKNTPTQTTSPSSPPTLTTESPTGEPSLESTRLTTLDTPIPPENANAPLFMLDQPKNGEEIYPELDFTGTFANLRSGWTLHILLQPLSGTGKYYPLGEYFTIPENGSEGVWKIHARLGDQFLINIEDTYIAALIVINNDDLRQQLTRAMKTGLDQIPAQALFEKDAVITLKRPAYRSVSEVRILFSSNVEKEENYEVFCVLPDGTDLQRITYTSDISELFPDLSPDGKKIVFVGLEKQEEQTISSIWLMDSTGKNRQKILAQPGVLYENPVWSPDGRYIAYSMQYSDNQIAQEWRKAIYEINSLYSLTESLDLHQMVTANQETYSERYLSWLDPVSLLYNFILPDSAEVLVWKFKTLEIRKFFGYEPTVLQPSLSPDGKLLAFVSFKKEEPNRDIYVIDLSTEEVSRLTTTPELDFSPQWLPDNQSIVFESWSTEKPTIWAIGLDGSNLRQLTFAPFGNDINPSVGLFDSYFRISD